MSRTGGWIGPLPDRNGRTLLAAAMDPDPDRATRALDRWWRGRDPADVPGTHLEVAAAAGERLGDPPGVRSAVRSWRRWATARSLLGDELGRRLVAASVARGVVATPRGDLATLALAGDAPWRSYVRGLELELAAGTTAGARARATGVRDVLVGLAGDAPGVPVALTLVPGDAPGGPDAAAHGVSLLRRDWARRPPGGLRWLLDLRATLGPAGAPDATAIARLRAAVESQGQRWLVVALGCALEVLGDAMRIPLPVVDDAATRRGIRRRTALLSVAAGPPLSRLRRSAS